MKEWVIVHSAKGTSWKKHKYIKKVGNRYYYDERDLAKGRKKAQAENLMRYNIRKVQSKYEQNNDEGRAWRNGAALWKDPIYFDADNPGSAKITKDNEEAVKAGKWGGYLDENMRKAIWYSNEAKSINVDLKAVKTGKEKALDILRKMNDTLDNIMWGGESKKKEARKAAKEWDRKINRKYGR